METCFNSRESHNNTNKAPLAQFIKIYIFPRLPIIEINWHGITFKLNNNIEIFFFIYQQQLSITTIFRKFFI